MVDNQKIIFISWTKYTRHSDLLGKALDAEIFFIDNLIKSRGLLWKIFFLIDYLSKSFRTLKAIRKTKPAFVFVQNPPSLTPIVIVFLSKLFRFKVAVDSHNGAFEKPWINIPFYKWSLKGTDLVIVHNNQLYNNLKNLKDYKSVNFKILNSRLSDFSGLSKTKINNPYILVITSFSGDEPVFEMMEGICLFNSKNDTDLKFKVTGNFKKIPKLHEKYSREHNIEFLGFVDENEYNNLLVNAFGAIALSTRNDVQQFALMEAIGAEVPFISSRNSTNQSLFNDQMVLTKNNSTDISEALEKFLNNRDRFYKNVLKIKKHQDEKWKHDFKQVKIFLGISK